MKKIVMIAFALGLLNNQASFAQANANASKEKKVLFMIVDGIPADDLERVYTPNIDQVSKDGGYTRAYLGGERGGYSETPTISAVGYNSLLTGTWANKHNVWGNDITAPNYNYWTIFRFLEEQYPEKKTAIFSTWLDNRTKLVGADLKETGSLKIDFTYDGFELDTVRFPHDNKSDYILKIDEEVVNKAADYVKENAPDLSWVYLQYTDDMGHIHGDSPEMDRGIQLVDRQVGEIYNAIRYRELVMNEEWLLIITTDHGRDIITGKGHGGQSDREKTTWISTNSKHLNSHFYANTPAVVDILPSIANFMNIEIPANQEKELDGVPFIGEVSVSHPIVKVKGDSLQIEWTPHVREGNVKVWLAETNNFNIDGTPDQYKLLNEVPAISRKLIVPFKPGKSKIYKVVIEGKENMINRWVVIP
ncbi:alkaline phosphatase family protein [Albibacterium bauzanense]|nr:alkaline phosphatase family protein [Albibacterium bauzanense]